MDIDDVLEAAQKYHYIGCGKRNCKLLSSSDSKTKAKNQAIKFLKPHEKELINSVIYLVTIEKIDGWRGKRRAFVGGPIHINLQRYTVQPGMKLERVGSGINDTVWVTDKYLKKNDGINIEDVMDFTFLHSKRKLKKGIAEMNFLGSAEKFLKKAEAAKKEKMESDARLADAEKRIALAKMKPYQ